MQCTGNWSCFPPGESEQPQYGATQFFIIFPLCVVFPCFRNPPNCDMDYRIFNVHTFLCVRIHTGVGHTGNKSAQHFDSEKLSQICLVLWTGFEPLVMESIGFRGRRSTN